MEVIDTVLLVSPDIARNWRSEFGALTENACFSSVSPLRCRVFVTLGCLLECRCPTALPFLNTLVCMRQSMMTPNLGIFPVNDHLLSSICFGLGRMSRHLSEQPNCVLMLFWFSISLMQIGNQHLFSLAARLALSLLDSPVIQLSASTLESSLLSQRASSQSYFFTFPFQCFTHWHFQPACSGVNGGNGDWDAVWIRV